MVKASKFAARKRTHIVTFMDMEQAENEFDRFFIFNKQ